MQFGKQSSSTILFLGGSSPGDDGKRDVSTNLFAQQGGRLRGVVAEGLSRSISGARDDEDTTRGDTLVAQGPGTNNKGPEHFGLEPDTNKWIPSKGGCTPTTASGDPEAPDILTNMLRHASVSKEHRTLMGTVVEKVLSVRSRLNEAFTSLLRGFEVCTVVFSIVFYSQNAPVYR